MSIFSYFSHESYVKRHTKDDSCGNSACTSRNVSFGRELRPGCRTKDLITCEHSDAVYLAREREAGEEVLRLAGYTS